MTIPEIKKQAKENGSFNDRTSNYTLDLFVPLFNQTVNLSFFNIKVENNEDD